MKRTQDLQCATAIETGDETFYRPFHFSTVIIYFQNRWGDPIEILRILTEYEIIYINNRCVHGHTSDTILYFISNDLKPT